MVKAEWYARLSEGTLTPDLARETVVNHASGNKLVDSLALAVYYSQELKNRLASKKANKNYEVLASAFAEYIGISFPARLSKLSKVGAVTTLLMGSRRDTHDHSKYRAVSVFSIHAKLPAVVAKIQAGDLARFVHLITTEHVYGACVVCRQLGQFQLLGPAGQKMRLSLDTSDAREQAGIFIGDAMGYPASFALVAGFCWKDTCLPHCGDCKLMVPVQYDPEWLTARKEDGLCPGCASKMLINVRRPTLGRRDQRRLHKLIID